ncbi:unnamed protein product [Musa acuminata subsp. burmannicoides]
MASPVDRLKAEILEAFFPDRSQANPWRSRARGCCFLETWMNLDVLTGKLVAASCGMDRGGRRPRRLRSQVNGSKALDSSYFTAEFFLVLVCLTASLLVLPLVLPALPPPPSSLLFVPIGILLVLLVLAFMPSDAGDIASSHL